VFGFLFPSYFFLGGKSLVNQWESNRVTNAELEPELLALVLELD